MKKLLIVICFIFSLLSCSSSKKETLYLGNNLKNIDYISFIKTKDEDVNDDFLMQDGYVSYLYDFIDNNAESNQKSIQNAIKNAKKIVINIGYNDLMRSIVIDEETNQINEKILNSQHDLFSYYFYLILENIRDNFKKDIYILTPFITSYDDIKEKVILENVLDKYYLTYEEIASYFSCKLIDLRDVSLLLNYKSNEELCEYIYQKVEYGN